MNIFKKKKQKKTFFSMFSRKKKSKKIIEKIKGRVFNHKKKRTVIEKIKNKFKEEEKYTPPTAKEQVFTAIYYEILGALSCLLILFILSGGKNYFKIYHDLSKLIETYDTITSNYYGTLNKDKLIDSAIDSMLSSIDDDFTSYNTKEETESFVEDVTGVYSGIGATVGMDNNNIIVVEVFKNTPSDKAGLKKNDVILKVDDKDYTNKTNSDLADYVKNSKKSKVKLTIKRNDKEQEITIKREKIELPVVSSKIIKKEKKEIGYIQITTFSSVSSSQFEKKLKKLENKKIDALIIDVRNNNGGYLDEVTTISSLFLKRGQIIYQLKDNKSTKKIKDKTSEKRTYPIAVLINESSASASEILASAIKESYKGEVIGVNSYGKGTVQKTKTLKDKTMIKYTIQKWLTPKGNWINKKGVTPTIEVQQSNNIDVDNQLDTATNILVEGLKEQ